MHELPATQGMLTVALEAARQAGAQRILAIDVVVGELTSVVADSVQFYFQILSEGTPAAGAALRFRRKPGQGSCLECGHAFRAVPPLPPHCAACGSHRLRVTGGREFYVERIEVEDADPGGEGDPQGERPGGA